MFVKDYPDACTPVPERTRDAGLGRVPPGRKRTRRGYKSCSIEGSDVALYLLASIVVLVVDISRNQSFGRQLPTGHFSTPATNLQHAAQLL